MSQGRIVWGEPGITFPLLSPRRSSNLEPYIYRTSYAHKAHAQSRCAPAVAGESQIRSRHTHRQPVIPPLSLENRAERSAAGAHKIIVQVPGWDRMQELIRHEHASPRLCLWALVQSWIESVRSSQSFLNAVTLLGDGATAAATIVGRIAAFNASPARANREQTVAGAISSAAAIWAVGISSK